MKRPELETRFEFGKAVGESSTIAEISNSKRNVIIHIREREENELEGGHLFLDPHEVDLFIAALVMHKHKVLNPRKDEEE